MNNQCKKIIFTGGGTAGHIAPNIALIEKLLENQEVKWEISYIGSKNGIEKELITKTGITFYHIATGKFRRYFSLKNFIDPFKIAYGIIQSLFLCTRIKPNIIFSKGGFVAFPVVVAGWCLKIPVIIHESDLTIGLANKLSFPFATKICVAFPETITKLSKKYQQKTLITGIPICKNFFTGDAALGRKFCGFVANKKTILILGGSLGANRINLLAREILPRLLDQFQIIHICGKNQVDNNYKQPGYQQFAYLHDEYPHILAAADLVISRAGANSIYELLILRKPNILLPLSATASRGDQIVNAKYCAEHGFSITIFAEELSANLLLEKILLLDKQRKTMISAMEKFEVLKATEIISELLTTRTSL